MPADEMSVSSDSVCWTCGGRELALAKRGNIKGALTSASVKISDAGYGRTADIYRCSRCGFLQCPNLDDVLSLYQEMDDLDYEATRAERTVQAQRLLDQVARHKPSGRLLDVGAGSGILVAEALERGYESIGIEPSNPLQSRATVLRLPIIHGVLPHPDVKGPFDIVTVIDVIEHVPDPVGLACEVAAVMARDGICVMVTPDVGSLAARLMGWRWWHYRIAHIGYFNKRTLTRAMEAAGLHPVAVRRPSWYFPMSYLMKRALSYFPARLRPPIPSFLDRIHVRLNLFDSLLVVLRKVE